MSCPLRPRAFALAFAAIALSACSGMQADPPLDWVSPIGRDHPLAGLTFEIATGRVVPEEEFVRAAASADFVLFGEQHDNIDHHRLQAALLEKLIAAGRSPAVAFEQINLEDQPLVDRALPAGDERSAARRASAVASAVGWKKSGWPEFAQYRPVFEVALAAQLPVRAANLSRKRLHAATSAALRSDDVVLPPLTDEMRASMEADIVDSHCGYADPKMVAMMLQAQRLRDASMAQAVHDALAVSESIVDSLPAVPAASDGVPATRSPGVVLICGFAHARVDQGVPLSLRLLAPDRRIVSIAFLGVSEGALTLAEYAAAFHATRLPFDYVTFTPRPDSEDPCEKYRADLQKMKAR